MIGQRLATAGVLIALFGSLFLLAPLWLLTVVATAIIGLASCEYFHMTRPDQAALDRLSCLLLTILFPLAASWGKPVCLYGSLFVTIFLLSVRNLLDRGELTARLSEIQHDLFGILYVGFTLSHILLLRHLEAWKPWIFLILIVTYAGDTAAYFSGSALGKRKLSPLLSPKKTVEGAVGGTLASILAGLVCKLVFFQSLTVLQVLGLSAVLSVSGQLGDLLESLIKRSYGIKDSGHVLPGHGGILDRIDSILFSVPVGYYLAVLT